MKKLISLTLIIVVAFLAFNCKGGGKTGAKLSEEQIMQLKKLALPIMETIQQGMNEDNYEKYSTDFDERMKNAITEKVFKQTQTLMNDKVGKFEAFTFDKVMKKDQFYVIMYKGKFEKEDNVKISLSIQKIKDKYFVSGLWFNSPKLRSMKKDK